MQLFRRLLKKHQSHKAPAVYTDLDSLPLWNWFKISDTNNLSYLFKDETLHGGTEPENGQEVYVALVYQMDNLDLTLLRLIAKAGYKYSKWLTDKKPRDHSEYLELQKEIEA